MNKLPELYELKFKYIDSAAAIDRDGNLNISLVNRSHDKPQRVVLNLPEGYAPSECWKIGGNGDINAANTAQDQEAVSYRHSILNRHDGVFEMAPCEVFIIKCKKNL